MPPDAPLAMPIPPAYAAARLTLMADAYGREDLVLPVLPLKNTVVFPHVLVPLAVGRPRSLRLLEDLPPGDRTLAVATIFRDRESLQAELAMERGV